MFGIKTGDIIFFSGNLLTGTVLKIMTSSKWNHVGIGVWLDNGQVTLQTGQLYIFEINTTPRFDAIKKECSAGIGFSDIDFVLRIYNTIGVRPMDDEARSTFMARLLDFYHEYGYLQYNTRFSKFIWGWLQQFYVTDVKKDGVFCTEMMALCLSYIFEDTIGHILGRDDIVPELCLPETYTYLNTPYSPIYPYPEYQVHYHNDNFVCSTIFLVVITIIVIALAVVITIIVMRITAHHARKPSPIKDNLDGTLREVDLIESDKPQS
jgi:hypothetical protein